MLTRSHRFHGLKALNFVYRNGTMARGSFFGVKSAYNPQRQSYRAAVVISKKIHKSSVARNRMRRRLYETLRLLEADLAAPYDIVLTIFSERVLDEPASALKHQLKKQLKASGAIVKKSGTSSGNAAEAKK